MFSIPVDFTPGSLYIAGFAQARAPHLGLIIPVDAHSGTLVHIRIDRATSPNWAYQCRTQKIQGDMFLSSLLRIHAVGAGGITVDQLRKAASEVAVPVNDEFGECGPWVFAVIQNLHAKGFLALGDVGTLEQEFSAFALGSRAFARRDRFPNVSVSRHCS